MHIRYMKEALKLAEKGTGFTNPNPLVGAVILKDGRVVGRGYHERYGKAHAEINALKDAGQEAKGATMYVTLEPCSHHGKTPPCAEAIIKSGIRKVVIASKDPNPLVSGRGIRMLKNAGIDVITGILDAENRRLNTFFFHHMETGKPYVLMKTAMSADGKIATRTHDSKWISNEKSREFVHELRHRMQAIMVGAGTVIHDNPHLTSRLGGRKVSQPVRIILDTCGETPLESHVLNTENARTIMVVSDKVKPAAIRIFEEKGAEVLIMPQNDGKIDLSDLMERLGKKGINSILLEGGAHVNDSAIRSKIVQEIHSFIAPIIIGGKDAPGPVGGSGVANVKESTRLDRVETVVFDEDLLLVYKVRYD